MNSDKRWQELAEVLTDHSVGVEATERVLIIMRETDAYPLTRAVYRRVVERGAYPQVLFHGAELERSLMVAGSDEQIDWVPELYASAMEWADVCIDLRGAPNLHEFKGVKEQLLSAHRRAEGNISALRTRKTRWTICRIPNALFAQQAMVSSEEMMELWFNACLIDWRGETERLERLKERFDGTREVRIEAEDTDLTFSTEGRTFIIDDGHVNMPGGEIFTAPLEDSVEGYITFSNPGVFAGVLMEGIRLTFSGGEVVEATARSNESFLHSILDMDEGARRVGEFALGTNNALTTFTTDILLDEKIAGTTHIALGRSYSEAGGKNDSALHWDIVKEMRGGGRILFDRKPVLFEGRLQP